MSRTLSQPIRRRGAALLVMMLCLLLVTIALGSLLELAFAERTQVRHEQARQQAEWLAESGVQRAVYQLALSVEYDGETWRMARSQLGGPDEGQVTIEVRHDDLSGAPLNVKVQATYPLGTRHHATVTRNLSVSFDSISNQFSQEKDSP